MDQPTPPPATTNAPTPTVDDPTAGGYYCGARRTPNQVAQERETEGREPWPWCRNRAGRGTDHAGIGQCRNHGGMTPNARKNARLRLDELVGPAFAVIARILTDSNVPASVRLRASQDVLDRAGYPRRLDLDVEAARENLVERIMALQSDPEAEN